MNILSTVGGASLRAVPSQTSCIQKQSDTTTPQPQDTFSQNLVQFLEGATPVLGGRPIFNKELMERYSPDAGAAIYIGQFEGCLFGLLAGFVHATQGLQAAAVGYGIAAVGFIASGIGHASAATEA